MTNNVDFENAVSDKNASLSNGAWVDCHAHPQFTPDDEMFALPSGLLILAGSVSPQDFAQLTVRFASEPRIVCGLGLHPWYITGDEVRKQLEAFGSACKDNQLISEIGLDYAHAGCVDALTQRSTMKTLLDVCAEHSGRVFCVHACGEGAATDVMNLFTAVYGSEFEEKHNMRIFHWFQGAQSELYRAASENWYFSVNKRMLRGAKGREVLKAVPANRLLLETDLPAREGRSLTIEAWETALRDAEREIVAIKGKEALEVIAQTAAKMFEAAGGIL